MKNTLNIVDSKYKILIIEDDEALRFLMKKKLEMEGFLTEVFATGQSFLDYYNGDESNTIVLMDYQLPDLNAKTLIEVLMNNNWNPPFIVITGHGDERIAVEMMKLGARDYLVKEYSFMDLLIPVIRQTAKQIDLEKKLAQVVSASREKDSIMILQSRQAAMGELIGNLSYFWKNPVEELRTIINNIVKSFDAGVLDKSKLDEYLKIVEIIAFDINERMNDIQILFSNSIEEETFSLNSAIFKAITLFKPLFQHHGIKIKTELNADITIKGNQVGFIHMMINILSNSKDALIQRKIEEPLIQINLLRNNNTYQIIVKDNAGGIPKNMINKVFDPYFTTKNNENSVGLGLFISKTYVERELNGRIFVGNTEHGAEFKIEVKYLP